MVRIFLCFVEISTLKNDEFEGADFLICCLVLHLTFSVLYIFTLILHR